MEMPQTLGPYKVVKKLGSGLMGDVYLGVKDNAYWALRLTGESTVRVTASVGKLVGDPIHDSVVRYKEIGTDQRLGSFISTDYVDARYVTRDGLAGMRSKGRLEFVISLLDGLAALHKVGARHGCIKPSNVLLRRSRGAGEAYGLFIDAGFMYIPSEKALPRFLDSTFPYFAPELIRSYLEGDRKKIEEAITVPADIYGAGLLVAEVLSGRRQFAGSRSVEDLLHRKMTGTIEMTGMNDPYEHLRLTTLNAVIRRATAAKPSERYDSMASLREALRECLLESAA